MLRDNRSLSPSPFPSWSVVHVVLDWQFFCVLPVERIAICNKSLQLQHAIQFTPTSEMPQDRRALESLFASLLNNNYM